MTKGTSEDRVQQLREQLRALGYLDAGVDRFVLGSATGRHGPSAVALAASIRVGLLGALLLGPAAAVGLGGRLPGLVSGVRDALVLAVYMSTLFFVGVTALTFLVSIGAAAVVAGGQPFRTRAAVLSSAAGWTTAIALLLYLTFWWRNANAGFGWSAPGWTMFALLVGVMISLLFGHAVRIATLAVAAARDRARSPLPPHTARSWRAIGAGAVLAFLGCSALLVLTASPSDVSAIAPSLTVVSEGHRVTLIAIDGVDPQLVAERDWVPDGLVVGARFRLQPQDTSDPARAWTTIATGEPPEIHGIQTIETRRVAGLRGMLSTDGTPTGQIIRTATDLLRLTQPSLSTRDQRKALTLWEVAELAGLRTSVVNWWASWPAISRGGTVISDRAALRLEHGGALDAEIAPPEIYPKLQQDWPSIRARAAKLASNSFADVADTDATATLRRSATLDATIMGLAEAVDTPRDDLDVIYLPGLDIAQHALFATGGEGAQAPSAMATRVAAMRSYYTFLSALTRPHFSSSQKALTILVMQPGRVASPLPGTLLMYQSAVPTRYVDLPPGIRDGGPAAAVDIAPTVLQLLGVPLSRELPGRERGPFPTLPRYVDTYGRPAAARPSRQGKPLDQEMIDRLRSLGYVR